MIKLLTYSQDKGDDLLEFNFNEPEIDFNSSLNSVVINATKQKIYMAGNSFIAFDTEANFQKIQVENISLARSFIQMHYKENQHCLIVSTKFDNPIMIFHGDDITLKSCNNDLYKFEIDHKPLFLYNLHYMVISRKTPV